MIPRHRVIALQALGVVVLGAIVYLAFLLPDDPGDLNRIEAGDSDQEIVQGPARQTTGNGGQGDSRPPGAAPETGVAGSAGATTIPLEPAPGVTPPSSEGAVQGDPDNPTDSQYQSAVAAIRDQITRP